MQHCESRREAIVIRKEGEYIYIRLSEPVDSRACSGCALAFTCGKGKEKELEIMAVTSHDLSGAEFAAGCNVIVEPIAGATRRATLLLFLLPLSVLLIVAAAATLSGVEQGIVALFSIASALLSYLGVYFYTKFHHTPSWRIIDLKDSNSLTI